MRDGWIEATLKEALESIANRPDGKDYPLVLSVTEKRGIIPQTEIFNHRIATDDISKYKVLEPMDIAYNPYLLWCGAIGQWQGTEAGVVSPVYECFRVKSTCEPRYLGYIFETGVLTNYFDALAIGSIVRRRRTIPSDFIAAPIQLPPLPEQKRIVDLISSVDSYIEALQQQLESAKRSRNAVLHELLTAGGDDWVEHKLIEMFEIYQPQTIAKSLMSEDGEFIVFGANGPIGRYHEFNHEQPEVVVTCRGATCGTINMTPPKTWITGNAMVVSPKTSGVSKEFLYWALTAGVDIQSVISGSAQPQITREGLAPVKIKIPPLSRQIEIVDLISGFELNISHLEESLYKTKTLRSGLLSDLLSGEHLIPSSYDKVMGAA